MSHAALPTAEELAAHRDALQRRLRVLQQEIAHDRERVADDVADARAVRDQKDQAMQTAQAGVDQAEWARDLDEEREVRAALLRIERGTYGRCVDCGQPIGRERLVVQPAAARCAACQARHEPQRGRR
jgi:RNA polymerase-binding transcription factor DksA